MFHRIVHFFHFQAVVLHDGTLCGVNKQHPPSWGQRLPIQSFGILFQVSIGHIRDLAIWFNAMDKISKSEKITLTLIS